MKKTKGKMFHVGLFFKTPSGRAGAKNYTIGGVHSAKEAVSSAKSRLRQEKKGRYKIKGGDAVEFKM